ncbi:MAG: DUF1800 domain-containing protein [Thermoanaerobaculia bacterium]
MQRRLPTSILLLTLTLTGPLPAFGDELPWQDAGLDERQAAAHLLDRFAYGPRPGDVDRVVAMGLETWLEQQLRGGLDDPEIERRLRGFESLGLSVREITETYPPPFMVLMEAQRAGAVDREAVAEMRARRESGEEDGRAGGERRGTYGDVIKFMRDKGYRPQRELIGETMVQKLYRALYSENQLTEVLTDFWFNHFNVSITDNESRVYVSAYERDAIRPHVLGDFRQMLEATVKHPAMLQYLDNARSVAEEGAPTTLERRTAEMRGRFGGGAGRSGSGRFGGPRRGGGSRGSDLDPEMRRRIEERRPQGLNENYARELMELHTLGVDGGYTQDDVVEVARAFTGWTTYPPGSLRREVEQRVERAKRFPQAGFLFEDSFIFRADAHDAGKKTVLGHRLAAGRGVEDGLEVLGLLAAHPSTARHLATKLAVRFVSDQPPASLVDRLAARYLETGGDLRQVTRTLAYSPDFWSAAARTAKIKSPFEVAVSALRVLAADVREPRAAVEWISRMGQPLYAYQAPTGYPDEAAAWVNTGALLNRMNFGLQLATGRVAGVRFDLTALNGGREPESLVAALESYVPLLLPERDPAATVERLAPVVRDPELAHKIEAAAPAAEQQSFWNDDWSRDGRDPWARWARNGVGVKIDDSAVAHVVGVILGSPDFQRR